ncbi:6751_t:CDS:2, partial [Gigaspora margarita]
DVLYRTGPGTFKIPSKENLDTVDYWFDGLDVNDTLSGHIAPAHYQYDVETGYKLYNILKNLDSVNWKYGSDKFPNAELVFATPVDLNVELLVFGCTPSDLIFVPALNTFEDDDCVIIIVVLDDIKIFKEIARAEMELGKVVSYGFHGLWNDHD